MAVITMRQLLEAGVHFGHQTRRWNPKMKKFIYTERNEIHVIDLQKTVGLIDKAYNFIKETVSKGGRILFVGTKKQAQEPIVEEAQRCGMFYVNQRWLGGMLTNLVTIRKSILRLEKIEKMEKEGILERLPKKEAGRLRKEAQKLKRALDGVRAMANLPAAIFVVDTKREQIAVREARRLGIPVIGIVDTNADPDEVTYPIPANDDAIRAIKLLVSVVAEAVLQGKEEQLMRKEGVEVEGITAPVEVVVGEGEIPEGFEETEEELPRHRLPPKVKPKDVEKVEFDLGESGLV